MLVDGLDDAVNAAYSAWPERLYLVDLDGKIAYRGGRGPDGFSPDELASVIDRCMDAWAKGSPAGRAARLPEEQEIHWIRRPR